MKWDPVALGAAVGGYFPLPSSRRADPSGAALRVDGVWVWRDQWRCERHDVEAVHVMLPARARRRLRTHLTDAHGVCLTRRDLRALMAEVSP